MKRATSKPTIIDLFCGCGGMSLGAARAGFEVVGAVDSDARAIAAHALNFPSTEHAIADLSKIDGRGVLKALKLREGQIDVVVGGPPCQGFSTIGKRNPADGRNLLIGDFLRLVEDIKPKAFVLENVPGILSDEFKGLLNSYLKKIGRTYEILEPYLLKAANVGAPTLRTRVFVIGMLSKHLTSPDFWTPAASKTTPVVREALDGLPHDVHSDWRSSNRGLRTVRVTRTGPFFDAACGRVPVGVGNKLALDRYAKSVVSGCLGTIHSAELTKRYASLRYGQMDPKTKSVKLDPLGYCPTLRAGTGPERGSFQAVRPIHYLRPRVITPREAARLQGFPDWYEFDETKWHSFRQIGNSVSPIVSEFVLDKVKGAMVRA